MDDADGADGADGAGDAGDAGARLHDVDGGVPRRGGARVRSRVEERVV